MGVRGSFLTHPNQKDDKSERRYLGQSQKHISPLALVGLCVYTGDNIYCNLIKLHLIWRRLITDVDNLNLRSPARPSITQIIIFNKLIHL